MKTFQQWTETNKHLDTFLAPGDEVDLEMVDYFRDTLPPRAMKSDLIQLGEPYEHFRDENRKLRGIYATLKRIGDKWIYTGLCFAGENTPAIHHLFVTQKSLNADMGFKYFQNVCNPNLWYLTDRTGQWHGLHSDGNLAGPLRAGFRIHFLNEHNQEISQEITREWEG